MPKGEPTEVKVYDFIDKALGKAVPYGVYDIANNEGWVSVGINHDTASFAVASIRSWWTEMGKEKFKGNKQTCLPAGRWNKIEHRLFSYISMNWKAKPLVNACLSADGFNL